MYNIICVENAATHGMLHSDSASPLKGVLHNHQVVSTVNMKHRSSNDNWTVKCMRGDMRTHAPKYLTRGLIFQLLHTNSLLTLEAGIGKRFTLANCPFDIHCHIKDHLELCASKSSSRYTQWHTDRGLYFATSEESNEK